MTQRDSMTVRAQRQRACVFIFFFFVSKAANLLVFPFFSLRQLLVQRCMEAEIVSHKIFFVKERNISRK